MEANINILKTRKVNMAGRILESEGVPRGTGEIACLREFKAF